MTAVKLADRRVAPLALDSLDFVWTVLREHFRALSQEEYLWEPVPGCWSVRECGDTVLVERLTAGPDEATANRLKAVRPRVSSA